MKKIKIMVKTTIPTCAQLTQLSDTNISLSKPIALPRCALRERPIDTAQSKTNKTAYLVVALCSITSILRLLIVLTRPKVTQKMQTQSNK